MPKFTMHTPGTQTPATSNPTPQKVVIRERGVRGAVVQKQDSTHTRKDFDRDLDKATRQREQD